ncbi:recombinase family protein [Amycolatopsis suaedae]|uniref:Recombinase family protein n=1 Tax=Amycolatopsis suaedae TaxID=2510978 RepID=A0A4Q7JCQ8_9PSEU|nr:recombinase family protein [Amycolatopsis suaedae]RZQ65107.1 recombinase family protein [Amycolatopsis suaedae]
MGADNEVNAGQGSDRPLVLDSYGRLSKKPDTGELEKVEDQWADNREVIAEIPNAVLGLELADGMSAWRRGARRKDWEKLLARVESGESQGAVIWHTDRLFRQPRDLEKLIELGESGYKIYSAHGTRDLSNPDDRYALRIEVAQACKSSDDKSRRIRRRFKTKRKQGRAYLGGPRRFGWPGKEALWTPGPGESEEDRPDVAPEKLEGEREAIRTGTDAQLAGIGLGTIAAEWNAAGVRSVNGNEFVPVTVRAVLERPANAGLIEYEGKLVGRVDGEPIVDPEKFKRLRALYAGRRRGRKSGETGQTYIGTGILRCDCCGMRLTARKQAPKTYPDGTTRATYYCAKHRRGCGKVFADMRAVDNAIMLFTVARLSDPRRAAAVTAARTRHSERLDAVEKEITLCTSLQAALSDRLGRRQMTLEAFDAANEPLVADLARLTAEREELEKVSPTGPGQAASKDALIAEWTADATTVADKRAMFLNALGRDRMTIAPSSRTGKRTFDKSRIKVIPAAELITADKE